MGEGGRGDDMGEEGRSDDMGEEGRSDDMGEKKEASPYSTGLFADTRCCRLLTVT
jgi:hypothetical protein